MTIDDSTIVTQAASGSIKRIRRTIHGSIGRKTVYAVFVLSNAIVAVTQASRDSSISTTPTSRGRFIASNWGASTFDPTPYLGPHLTSFILRSVVLPYLISYHLRRNPTGNASTSSWPSIAATTTTALIPLLSIALGNAGREGVTDGQMVMIALTGMLRFDMLQEQTLAFSLLAFSDPLSAIWCYFNGLLNMVRYAQAKDKATTPRAVKLDQLLEDTPNLSDYVPRDIWSLMSRSMSSWPRSQRIMSLVLILWGPINVFIQIILSTTRSGKNLSPHDPTTDQSIPHRLLLASIIMLPVLLNGSLGRTIKGAADFGLHNKYGLCYTITSVALRSYYAWRGRYGAGPQSYLSAAAVTTATLICTWTWWYRIKSSVTVSYAILMTTAIFASAGITSALDLDPATCVIPLILYRIYLAGMPPTPRPRAEEEKEKRKPDPQKGLTVMEERDVDLVLEFGWYLLLTTLWTTYKV